MNRPLTQSGPSRLVPLASLGLAVILTLLSGILHGHLTRRWSDDAIWAQAAQRLQGLPTTFGDWQLASEPPLSQSAIELLQCQGHIHRIYRNLNTGQQVRIAVMVGPGARMSIHVPEICYEAANYTLVVPRKRVELQNHGRTDSFWSVRFRLNDVSEQPLHVLYAWSRGDAWLAPRLPRWSVAGTPVLYKLQLSTMEPIPSSVTDEEPEESGSMNFLRTFLPLLRAQSTVDASPDEPMDGPADN